MKKFITVIVIALAFSLVALSACKQNKDPDHSGGGKSVAGATSYISGDKDSLSGGADNSPSGDESGAISPSSASMAGDESGAISPSAASASESALNSQSQSASGSSGITIGGDYSDSETWYPL